MVIVASGLVVAGSSRSTAPRGWVVTVSAPSPPESTFCLTATTWAGHDSLNVEWALGLNDNRPFPGHVTATIGSSVRALAESSALLSRLAPTPELAATLQTIINRALRHEELARALESYTSRVPRDPTNPS